MDKRGELDFIMLKNKRAQAWSLDLVIASVIFMVAVGILFFYTLNYYSQSSNQLDEMFYEGYLSSELILSKEDFGILSGGKVNQTKLDNFNSSSDQQKKDALGLRNNFYFTIPGMIVNGVPASYVGIVNTSAVDNLIQITRIAVYNNKPVKFQLYVWG